MLPNSLLLHSLGPQDRGSLAGLLLPERKGCTGAAAAWGRLGCVAAEKLHWGGFLAKLCVYPVHTPGTGTAAVLQLGPGCSGGNVVLGSSGGRNPPRVPLVQKAEPLLMITELLTPFLRADLGPADKCCQ